jgi:uncharacterized membrane protein
MTVNGPIAWIPRIYSGVYLEAVVGFLFLDAQDMPILGSTVL